jgi:hypothetical protein
MKISELTNGFEIFVTNEEKAILEKLTYPRLLDSFSERDKFIIEGMIRKSLVIKIGQEFPRVISNEL